MALKVGDKAPAFTLPTDGEGTVSLAGLKGKKVVLYFYARDDTPGCTKEACNFRDDFRHFTKTDAVVVGVSKDSVASHDKFKKKYKLPFLLGSDKELATAKAYGVWVEKSFMGRKFMGMERATFLIDSAGVIRGVWHKVKVPGHAEEVLKAAQEI
jgi:thioredoxin-dependent peroxiredoxin